MRAHTYSTIAIDE